MQNLSLLDRLILWVSRGDSRPARAIKLCIRRVMSPAIFVLPRWLKAPLRAAYEFHYMVVRIWRTLVTVFYRAPLFQARCASFGRGNQLDGSLPFVHGHVQIHVGNGVVFGGNVSILSGRVYDEPKLIIGDRVGIGWNTRIVINQEVIIEDDVWLPYDCRISDSDGHPREADLRIAMVPPDRKDIRPVRICKKAWIGNGTHIMKGVTIGEGAIIGANSVVISNVPAYALAMGNPAEVILKNFGLPSTAKPAKKPAPES
jgi:acetyltransferase-like isoleucine patch superfamily enzyme